MLERQDLIRGGLKLLHGTGAWRALEGVAGGIGVIFTLHRVRPARPGIGPCFDPNGILEITPQFLDAAIARCRERGLALVSLDEALERIAAGGRERFAAFTIDDGYRDSADIAHPVFARHGCPFTIYVATGLIDRTVNLWWLALELAIAAHDRICADLGEGPIDLDTSSVPAKRAAFGQIYWRLRAMDEADKLAAVKRLAAGTGVDITAIAAKEGMGWDDVRRLAADPLVTIGGHTLDHPALARLPAEAMVREMSGGRDRLATMLGAPPRHFAYPYGDPGSAGPREFQAARDLGFASAVTTRKGVIHAGHRDHLHALPRVSLNGAYQDLRFLDLFISGAPFALANGFRRLNVA